MQTFPLTSLSPQFLKYINDGGRISFHHVDTIDEAQGIKFLCPLCFEINGGPAGTHAVICWSRSKNVPDDVRPNPGRWRLDGTGYSDLTLNGDAVTGGGARSVQLNGGCNAHFHITSGQVHP